MHLSGCYPCPAFRSISTFPVSMKKLNSKILALARLTRRLTFAGLVVGAASWMYASWLLFSGSPGHADGGFHVGVTVPGQMMGAGAALDWRLVWMVSTLALAVTAFGLVRLIELMRIYESGVIFDRRASHLLTVFAAAIFVRELIDVVALPLLSLVAHINDGHTPVSFHIGAPQVHVLFITLIFVLISRIMAVGHKLADDNAKII